MEGEKRGGGHLFVVGIGPGSVGDRTIRAEAAIRASRVLIGYEPYLAYVRDLWEDREIIATGMRQEISRCQEALARAAAGTVVSLISGGDPGIYGMAGLVLELAHRDYPTRPFPIEIVPGVTAACAAAARLGAPLMCDFAVISLSDLLQEWATIRTKLLSAARGGLVTVLYNPRSHRRQWQLKEAVEIFLSVRPPETPVGVVTAVGSPEETVTLCTLATVLRRDITMRSIVIIGTADTAVIAGLLVTRRGYEYSPEA